MISLQLMRRFIAGLNCSSKNWPQEYVEQFSPLISHCSYNKGSLVTEAFEHSLSNSATQPLGVIKPLPPTHECALFPHEKEALLPIVQELVGHESYDILTLFQKCKAIFVRNFIIGSNGSRFTTSSHVMAKHPNDQYFVSSKNRILCQVGCKNTQFKHQLLDCRCLIILSA